MSLSSFLGVLLGAVLLACSVEAGPKEEYFLVRQDTRECAFPRCGGYWLNPVNVERFDCPGGEVSRKSECYVAEIRSMTPVTPGIGLVRGFFKPMQEGINAFQALEVFDGNVRQNTNTDDVFLTVKDVGIQCIAAPCLSFHATRLNDLKFQRNVLLFAELDLTKLPGREGKTREEMRYSDVVVSAKTYPVSGPGGSALGLEISNVFFKSAEPARQCQRPADCDKSEVCAKTSCEASVGVCKVRPSSCSRALHPVCACDGVREFDNDCIRQLFGVVASRPGKCQAAA